ncbi:MAG TPA: lysine--tRNA ligase [Elusimicrobiota bacterium]|nr:lysine--tRNA ligase [Elusimicrobiota bacterium]
MEQEKTSSLEDIARLRRDKVRLMRENNIDPYPRSFDGISESSVLREKYQGLNNEEHSPDPAVKIAGRLMTRRDMGKTTFAHVQDRTGRLQIYMRKDEIGDAVYKQFRDLVDLGDILGLEGNIFKTRTGEVTLKVTSWRILSKALRPPPEKFHGMTDVEERYRRREVDLFSNKTAVARFQIRQKIVSEIRKQLEADKFIEVETPMMHPVPGGATARPFVTHHEALDSDLYMRIAPELYLKRLIVGGMERVYEIGRAFRNEGVDTRHNPEFTILEAYQAYTDYKGMMDLVEKLIRAAAEASKPIYGDIVKSSIDPASGPQTVPDSFNYRGKSFTLNEPFARLTLEELFKKHLDLDFRAICRDGSWKDAARKAGLTIDEKTPDHKCFDRMLDERILPHLPEAAIVHDYPKSFSPLAKSRPDAPEIAERFELFIAGEEVANAYSEQNDPDVQRQAFQDQVRKRQEGDKEAMPCDDEFVIALEYGMPPAGGLGVGIDRLTMLLSGTESIREVILFPLLRSGADPSKT